MVGFRIQQRVQRLFDRRPNHFIQIRLNASFIDLYYRTQVPLDPVFRPSSRFHGWLHRARLRGLAPPACTNLHASNSNQMCERNPTLSYCNHSPLYRQSVALLRDAGIDISRATMCGWVMTIGEMLMPVSAAMRSQLLAGTYIQADETPVDVQTHDGSGSNHQGYLWQYGTPGGMTVFDFQMSRKREGPLNFLGNFEGLLQTDGYAAYDRLE